MTGSASRSLTRRGIPPRRRRRHWRRRRRWLVRHRRERRWWRVQRARSWWRGLGLAGLGLAAVDALLLLLLLLATAVPPQKLHVRHLQNLQWLAALETLQKAPHVS